MTNDSKNKTTNTLNEYGILEYLDKMLSVHDYTLMQENVIILDTICEWIIAFKNNFLKILNSIEIFKFRKLTFVNFLRIKVLVKMITNWLGSANSFNDNDLNEIYQAMRSKVNYIDKWMLKNWKKILLNKKITSFYLTKYIELYSSSIKQEDWKEFILLMNDCGLETTINHLIKNENLRFLAFKRYFSSFDFTIEKGIKNLLLVLNEYKNNELSLKEKEEYKNVLNNLCMYIVDHKLDISNLLHYSYELVDEFKSIYEFATKKLGFKTNLYQQVINKLKEIENFYLLNIRANFMPTNEYANSGEDYQNFIEIIEDIKDIRNPNDLYGWFIEKIPKDLLDPNYFDVNNSALEKDRKILEHLKYEKLKSLIKEIEAKTEFLDVAIITSENFLNVYKTFFHKSLIKFIDKFPAIDFITVILFYNLVNSLILYNKGIDESCYSALKGSISVAENILDMISESNKKLSLLELLDHPLVIKYFSKTVVEVLKCYLYEINFPQINKTYGFNIVKQIEKTNAPFYTYANFVYFLFVLTTMATKMFLDLPDHLKKYDVKKKLV